MQSLCVVIRKKKVAPAPFKEMYFFGFYSEFHIRNYFYYISDRGPSILVWNEYEYCIFIL